MQIVVAKWQDTTTFGQWTTAEEVEASGLKICYAAGFLVEEDKDIVKIALLTADDKGSFSNWINIPVEDVLELTVVKEVDWNDGH